MASVGESRARVDAFEKATGRARYTNDLCGREALVVKIVRSTIANGRVKSIDLEEAQQVPGVGKMFTCFDVPPYRFPTAGHP